MTWKRREREREREREETWLTNPPPPAPEPAPAPPAADEFAYRIQPNFFSVFWYSFRHEVKVSLSLSPYLGRILRAEIVAGFSSPSHNLSVPIMGGGG